MLACGPGRCFSDKAERKEMLLKTANGGEMTHYGQKELTFNHDGNADVVGLTFQVTDVKKPLLAVRRLVERGNKVVLPANEGESYIQHIETQTTVPVRKKGGSFVIEAHFVQKMMAMDFKGQA